MATVDGMVIHDGLGHPLPEWFHHMSQNFQKKQNAIAVKIEHDKQLKKATNLSPTLKAAMEHGVTMLKELTKQETLQIKGEGIDDKQLYKFFKNH